MLLCLFDLASFFLSSFSSLIKICTLVTMLPSVQDASVWLEPEERVLLSLRSGHCMPGKDEGIEDHQTTDEDIRILLYSTCE